MQRAGPRPVLSGRGRELSGLAAVLSLPMGVDGCETQTIGYTCRRSAPTIFGQGFNSPRLHQTALRAFRRLTKRSFSSLAPPDKSSTCQCHFRLTRGLFFALSK
jgi:hypothetical protein